MGASGCTYRSRDGKNKETAVLSATIVARDCMTADALATACMVLGEHDALNMVEQVSNTSPVNPFCSEWTISNDNVFRL